MTASALCRRDRSRYSHLLRHCVSRHSSLSRGLAVFGLLVLFTACSLLFSPARSYVANRDLLDVTAREAGFEVDPAHFELVGVDLRDDVVTFQYKGKEYSGDQSWVMRFSEKSTERDTIGLSDVHSLAGVLSEGRRSFAVVDDGERPFESGTARYLRYTFESPVRDDSGEALVGRGIFVVLRRAVAGGVLVYQIKLDNYGDRDELVWSDLAPLLAPLAER